MKISFSNVKIDEMPYEKSMGKKQGSSEVIRDENTSYVLSLTKAGDGISAYREEKKSKEDIKLQALGQNMDVMQDYMTVMSNTLSEKDYGLLSENGFQITEMSGKETVTIVDKIKATLMESGVHIPGYTDDMDQETLEKITGNKALAQEMLSAFQEKEVPLTQDTAEKIAQVIPELRSLGELSDGTIKYLVTNQMTATAENLYKASFSSGGNKRQEQGYFVDSAGYLSKKAEAPDWNSLNGQMLNIAKEAGLEEKEGVLEDAKWLVEMGIPLTADTLWSFSSLQNLKLPMEDNHLMEKFANGVSDGKEPKNADLSDFENLWEKSERIYQDLQNISDEAAYLTAEEGGKLTLHNLRNTQKRIDLGASAKKEDVKARRVLEETRLQMTIAANRELLKSGYKIETETLEDLVEALKKAEHSLDQVMYGGTTVEETGRNASLYLETRHAMEEIPAMPIAAVATGLYRDGNFSLEEVTKQGRSMALIYRQAGESYETFATEIRTDLGDSIRKAFQNAPELLKEMSMEPSQGNLRAVRILGYNRMEITEENMDRVKLADQTIQNVVDRLTPAATLKMIRDGKNPLEMNLQEMEDYLAKAEANNSSDVEKYSKFLYKLEKNHDITPEEKSSYIGIYRLLRQVEKTDGAVIGSLLQQGAELSFKNMLSAVRSRKAAGMDVTADDQTGYGRSEGMVNSIADQIGAAFEEGEKQQNPEDDAKSDYARRLVRKVYHDLEGDRIHQIQITEDMTLDQLAERLSRTENTQSLENQYQKEEVRQIWNLGQMDPGILQMLEYLEEPVTVQTMAAMQEYASDPAGLHKLIKKKADQNRMDVSESIASLERSFESEQEAKAAVKKWIRRQKEVLEQDAYGEGNESSFADIQRMGLLYKQISFTAKMAEREQYEIPILTGDSCMTMHLQILHRDGIGGRIETAINTEKFGKITASMEVGEKNISLLLMTSEENVDTMIERIQSAFFEEAEKLGYQVQITGGYRRDIQALPQLMKETKVSGADGSAAQKDNIREDNQPATNMLYRISKAFVVAVSNEMGRN